MSLTTSEFTIFDGSNKVEYNDTLLAQNRMLAKIIDYCKRNNCCSGESLMQDDDCILEAPKLLSDIIDNILKFKTSEL